MWLVDDWLRPNEGGKREPPKTLQSRVGKKGKFRPATAHIRPPPPKKKTRETRRDLGKTCLRALLLFPPFLCPFPTPGLTLYYDLPRDRSMPKLHGLMDLSMRER